MRLMVALLVLLAIAAPLAPAQQPNAPRPTSLQYCYADQFALVAGPYQRARPAPGATPARIDAGDPCIGGDLEKCRRVPLESTSAWTSGARLGDWICVSDGRRSGWVPASELVLAPAQDKPIAAWAGTWKRDLGDATVTIRPRDDRQLVVSGEATWTSGPDAVPHLGSLDASARASGVELVLGDPRCVAPDRSDKADKIPACQDCNARLLLVGTTLIVADNRNCGGMNVNFDGLYHRSAIPSSKRMPDGKQWMTENLNVETAGSYCYGDSDANCRRYGRLYTWESAQRTCRSLGEGWHLPTNDEWQKMAKPHGGVRDDSVDGGKAAYQALMTGGSSGFDAVYGGGRTQDGQYARVEAHGFYWTASETGPASAWFYNLGKGRQILNRHADGEKDRAFAVRCVRE